MVQLRHVGIYVKNLDKMSEFYKNVFKMKAICENAEQQDELIKEITGCPDGKIYCTKLITEFGQFLQYGEMIELLKAGIPEGQEYHFEKICNTGCMHIALHTENMEQTVENILRFGGRKKTEIHCMKNGNKCCMCTDPEGNWLELIEQAG